MKVALEIPDKLYETLEELRKANEEAENPEQAALSRDMETWLVYVLGIGAREL